MSLKFNRTIFGWLMAGLVGYCSLSQAEVTYDVSIIVVMTTDNAARSKVLDGFQNHLAEVGVQAKYSFEILGIDSEEHGFHSYNYDERATLFLTLDSRAAEVTMRHQPDSRIISALVLKESIFDLATHTTGVLLNHSVDTQLDYLQKILPAADRVGVLFNSTENQSFVLEAQALAQKRGLSLVTRPVHQPRDLPKALRSLGSKAEVIWGIPDRIVLVPETIKHLLIYSFRNHTPLTGLSESWVKAGALFALERDYFDIGVQCAEMALKTLQGTPLENISVSTPRRIRYMLNLKTARHMNLDITPEIIQNAYEVFE